MQRKIISGIVLALLALGLATFAFNIRGVKAQGLVGDLNDDGKVNIEDLIIAAQAFGSTAEHPRWNAKADLNGDGKINVLDIILIATHYGEST